MMCSVSLRPVMKMTGTWARALFCFRRRQVSKPSVPGISASMRMMSGSTRSMIESAYSPSRATNTVMPASSIASVSIRSVSRESSTTSTMSLLSFLRMAATNCLQRRRVPPQVERIHDGAHVHDEIAAFRRALLDLAQLLENLANVADLAQTDQLIEVAAGGQREWSRCDRRNRLRLGLRLVGPFDVEERVDLLEQLAQIDRLHHVIVVQAFSLQQPTGIDRVGRQYDDGGRLARSLSQPACDLPAADLGHGDIEQDEVRLVTVGERQAFHAGRRGQNLESQWRQEVASEPALDLVVVDDQDSLTRRDIAAHAILLRRGDAWP